MSAKPQSPNHLTKESRAWYAKIAGDYVLEAHHLSLLQAAAECWDRAQQARAVLAKEGICFTDRHGHIRPHPCTQIERDNKSLFSRLLRELGLDIEAPGTKGNRP